MDEISAIAYRIEAGNQAPKTTGVYVIHCKANDFTYIGSTGCKNGFRRRLSVHFHELKKGVHKARLLKDWQIYGPDAFDFRVLEECPPERRFEREQFWLDVRGVGKENKSYNHNPQAASSRGCKLHPHVIAAMSERKRGQKLSEAHRLKISIGNMGKHRDSEVVSRCARNRVANKLYIFKAIAPDGSILWFKHLTGFCKQMGLKDPHLYQVLHGKRESYKGWRFEKVFDATIEPSILTPEILERWQKHNKAAIRHGKGGRKKKSA